MNYIKHLTGFFDRVIKDEKLNATHISMYVSLFQFWNVQRFANPISISRSEVMQISKISSKATYHKCMKDLHNLGYLRYDPSFNPLRGSHVHLLNFENDIKEVQKLSKSKDSKPSKNQSSSEQELNKQQTSGELVNEPSINNTNSTNILNLVNGEAHSQNEKVNVKILKPILGSDGKKEKLRQKKKVEGSTETQTIASGVVGSPEIPTQVSGKRKPLPPLVEEVKEYFTSQEYDLKEAQKFFNYFQSNGWLVGGKSEMKDWQAAARNWILNADRFNAKPKNSNLNATTTKNYNEPL